MLFIMSKHSTSTKENDELYKLAAAHFLKGDCLRNLSKFEEAMQCFNKAIELNPDYVEAHTYKEACENKMADPYANASLSIQQSQTSNDSDQDQTPQNTTSITMEVEDVDLTGV